MISNYFRNSLTFNNYIIFTDKIYPIGSIHHFSMIDRMKCCFSLIWNPSFFKFHPETLLVAVFI